MRDSRNIEVTRSRPYRRAIVAVAMIIILLLINLIIVGMVVSQARDHDLTVRRQQTVEAFYAAEAGVNMSIRELMVPGDEDGDGVTGTISYENNPGPYDPDNDPILGNAQFYVLGTDPVTTLTSEGRSGEARRTMTAELTP
jgi:hypothetical protein